MVPWAYLSWVFTHYRDSHGAVPGLLPACHSVKLSAHLSPINCSGANRIWEFNLLHGCWKNRRRMPGRSSWRRDHSLFRTSCEKHCLDPKQGPRRKDHTSYLYDLETDHLTMHTMARPIHAATLLFINDFLVNCRSNRFLSLKESFLDRQFLASARISR